MSTARSNSATSQQLLQQHHITSLTSRQYHITSHQPQQLNNNQQPPQQHITPGHNNKTTATQQLLQLQLHQQLQLRHTLIITCSNSAAAGARIADMLHVTLYRQSPCTANHPVPPITRTANHPVGLDPRQAGNHHHRAHGRAAQAPEEVRGGRHKVGGVQRASSVVGGRGMWCRYCL